MKFGDEGIKFDFRWWKLVLTVTIRLKRFIMLLPPVLEVICGWLFILAKDDRKAKL